MSGYAKICEKQFDTKKQVFLFDYDKTTRKKDLTNIFKNEII